VLFTEASLFSSVVQRAGRCNRAGEFPDGAELLWAPPPGGDRGASAPYEEADVEAAVKVLSSLEGMAVTSTMLQDLPVDSVPVVHPVLRRRDLLQLFDTMPDLSGADIDVSQWIRDGDDTTAMVAWRQWSEGVPGEKEPYPARDELCPAPLRDLKALVKERPGSLWSLDVADGVWRRAQVVDVYPGTVLLTSVASGLYDPDLGWGPKHRRPVMAVAAGTGATDGMGGDHSSCGEGWVTLAEHLADVEREVRAVAEEMPPLAGLPTAWLEAARFAGLYHDLGKAHHVFCKTIQRSCPDGENPPGSGPWAKSLYPMGRHERKFFRHELVSALALLHPDSRLLDESPHADLVVYLAAAHHGKVRISVRSMKGEAERTPPRVLGVEPEERLGPLELPYEQTLPAMTLDSELLFLGGGRDGAPSWAQRTSRLLAEHGPFRLAFLEALVRIADWRASRRSRLSAGQGAAAPDRTDDEAALYQAASGAHQHAAGAEQEALW
jgi:CRISPR-associated endonuclease/helicase Cas3